MNDFTRAVSHDIRTDMTNDINRTTYESTFNSYFHDFLDGSFVFRDGRLVDTIGGL